MKNPQNAKQTPKFNGKERDTASTRRQFESIVDVLQTRFEDYSESNAALKPLSPSLDLATLRQIFQRACRADSFKAFCEELNEFWLKRSPRVKLVDEKRELEFVTAQLFNNFVVGVLEQRRRIGAAFLRRYVGEISPKLSDKLDFAAYTTEPTVYIFGSQVSRLCDLVFTIPYKDRSEGSLAVVVPMEHKSAPSRNVVFQLLTSLVLVLQFVLQHKERFQRSDKRFVWPFLLLFYTGARPWRKILNLRDIFGTSEKELDDKLIFLLPFKVVNLFEQKPRESQTEDDAWLNAFLALTKEAERIVAKKDVTEKDWEDAFVRALKPLSAFYSPNDEETKETIGEFVVFANKVTKSKGWRLPTRTKIAGILEQIGEPTMMSDFKSVFDVEREEGYEEGLRDGRRQAEQQAERQAERQAEQMVQRLQRILKTSLNVRFPRISQTALDSFLSIKDVEALASACELAISAASLTDFKKSVRGLAPTN